MCGSASLCSGFQYRGSGFCTATELNYQLMYEQSDFMLACSDVLLEKRLSYRKSASSGGGVLRVQIRRLFILLS